MTTPVKIHLLTATPMGILMVYRYQLWQFRAIANYGSVYGLSKNYYTAEAAEAAGRQWVGAGW